MFNENLEIFFPEYTKKIKLLAKIETTENDASITKYLLQTHGTTYVLQHSFTEGFYYYRDPENILEIYDIDDIFTEIQGLNKDISLFYIPKNKNLELIENNENTIAFNLLTINTKDNIILESEDFTKISYIDFMSTLGREVKEEQEVDYINQFLRNTFKKNPITGMSETRPLFVFGDKTTISIQASNFTYCSPRQDGAKIYESVECGFPSKPIEQLFEYAEEEGVWTETVYPYVPVEVLNEIIKEKGIDKNFRQKYIDIKNIER